MNDIYVSIAVEDVVSEHALRKILQQTGKNYVVMLCLEKNGNAYLQSKAAGFNNAAQAAPFIMLTDMDTQGVCPQQKQSDWLGGQPLHPNFLFRIAVMEIEAWILADREAFANYFRVPLARIPENTDHIANPKEFLVILARSSTSYSIRDDLVPRARTTAVVGPNYNGRLLGFIENFWNAHRAANWLESLSRAMRRFTDFVPV